MYSWIIDGAEDGKQQGRYEAGVKTKQKLQEQKKAIRAIVFAKFNAHTKPILKKPMP